MTDKDFGSNRQGDLPTDGHEAAVLDLVRRLERGERSNALDVLVEIALFEPCENYTAVVSNNAGTKVIYSKAGGGFETCWARDWSLFHQDEAINRLKATTASAVGTERSE